MMGYWDPNIHGWMTDEERAEQEKERKVVRESKGYKKVMKDMLAGKYVARAKKKGK